MAQKTLQIVDADGSVIGKEPVLAEEELRSLYRQMLLLRILDERMIGLQRQGRIGFYGPASGEEAAVVGSAYCLGPQDWIYPALRQGGAALLRGYPLMTYVAQCLGNEQDVLKGHMQPCHFASRQVNHVSWSSCIGNQLPQAVGTAMAARYLVNDTVVLAYLGDGATSSSDFHVAMNFAGVYKPPVIFFCQNNQWAISVPLSRQTRSEDLVIKAGAYGVPGMKVDGNDILAVYAGTMEAVETARSGKGPTFIEAVTYRMFGHSTADDPTRYRPKEEVEEWEGKDPLRRFWRYLEKKGIMERAEEEAMRQAVTDEVLQGIKMAEEAGPVPPGTLLEDVFEEEPWHLLDQKRFLLDMGR